MSGGSAAPDCGACAPRPGPSAHSRGPCTPALRRTDSRIAVHTLPPCGPHTPALRCAAPLWSAVREHRFGSRRASAELDSVPGNLNRFRPKLQSGACAPHSKGASRRARVRPRAQAVRCTHSRIAVREHCFGSRRASAGLHSISFDLTGPDPLRPEPFPAETPEPSGQPPTGPSPRPSPGSASTPDPERTKSLPAGPRSSQPRERTSRFPRPICPQPRRCGTASRAAARRGR